MVRYAPCVPPRHYYPANEPRLQRLYRVQNGRCFYCAQPLVIVDGAGRRRLPPNAITQDHLLPKSKGGTRAAYNIVGACNQCNQARGAMDWVEYKAKFTTMPPSPESEG